jgi:hypothetical protein
MDKVEGLLETICVGCTIFWGIAIAISVLVTP